ncbi:hypothetical protein B0T25DRAFT_516421 [Lasiosphaeria hispida]|uniref:Uncharacterized protein n=1 Tax=Lasiosphaeria hispida TaxID=260671 RepID=A0AAJ0HLC2_9PEZI|nr:hypothetical protein B0T25DRAFT_516421 [Lasiosphaeria hispida]
MESEGAARIGISAAYITTQQRAEVASTHFNCYLSIDGKPMNLGDLNAETVSHLKIPAENLNITIHSTWFPGQYSMVVITIFATDIPAMRDAIGTITIKGTSITSCTHHSHVGRENVASALKTFCGSIEQAANFPHEIVQLDLQCSKVNLAIHDQIFNALCCTPSRSRSV